MARKTPGVAGLAARAPLRVFRTTSSLLLGAAPVEYEARTHLRSIAEDRVIRVGLFAATRARGVTQARFACTARTLEPS